MAYDVVTLKERPDIAKIVKAVAPKYRKHRATVVVTDKVTPTGTYWDGGSRSSYWHAHPLPQGGYIVTAVPAPTAPPQFGGGEQPKTFDIPKGDAVVQLGTFRGKSATAHVYINN